MTKLLLVDDSTVMRQILRRVLCRSDLPIDDILEAANGIEALERLSANHDIGLVLSDVHMPGMNGVELVRAIRERHPQADLPVVMLTTESGRALAASAVAHGANGFVCKLLSPESVRDELGRYIGRCIG